MNGREQVGEIVFRSPDRKTRDDCAMMLKAVGIDCLRRSTSDEYVLIVAARDVGRATAELDSYEAENLNWAEIIPRAQHEANRTSWPGVLGYVAVLLVVFALDRYQAWGFDWVSSGKTQAGLIRQGQWWRLFTALTLHADSAHLVANLVIGGWFGFLVSQRLGSGVAWFGILLAGAMGNLLNAFIHEAGHSSIGASTAIFAALGIASVIGWRSRVREATSRWVLWAPIIAAIVLLSYLGTSGERTDVAAHVTGFFSGLVWGAGYGSMMHRISLGTKAQWSFGLATMGIIVICWRVAPRIL